MHRRLDRRAADLAVTLCGVPVPDAQAGTFVEHRQEEGGARRQVARVHVPAMDVGRDRRARAVHGRDPDLATERDDRHADAGQEFGEVTDRRQACDPERGIGELVREQAETRDARRPAPVGRPEIEQIDLQGVAGLGAFDGDRSVDLVDAIEIEVGEVVQRRGRRQLPAARIETVERDRAARCHRGDGWDGGVPGEV